MKNEFSAFPSPNRLIHEPARLAILTVLSECSAADFVFLQSVTGLTRGNLSVQLTNLQEAGLVTITKEIVGKKSRTTVRLAGKGKVALDEYWSTMEEIRERARQRNKSRKELRVRLGTLSSEPA